MQNYASAISELTQTIDLESKQKADEAEHCNLLATTQAEVIDDLFEDLEEITPDDGDGITNWLGSLQTSGSTIGTVATTEQSARSGRNSANTTTLNDLKATLKTERETAEKAADRLYRNSEQGGWNAYLIGVQTANTTYLGSVKTSENTYKTASDVADTAYRSAAVTAYTNYHQSIHALDTAFYAAATDANDVNFTITAYFTTTGANPNLSFQKTTIENTSKTVDHKDCPYCKGTGIYLEEKRHIVGGVMTGPYESVYFDEIPCSHQSQPPKKPAVPAPEFAGVAPQEFPPPESYFSQGNDSDPDKTQLSFIVVPKSRPYWWAEKLPYSLARACSHHHDRKIAN